MLLTRCVLTLVACGSVPAGRWNPPPGDHEPLARASVGTDAQAAAIASEPDFARLVASLRVWPLQEKRVTYPPHDSALAQTAAYAAWKRFEDEFIVFDYPDDGRIVVSVLDGEAAVKVSGGVLSTEPHKWFRAYRLAAGDETYCLIMLERTDSFDDSVCFCGSVVFKKCRFIDNALYRFSFLETGEIKQIQARCDHVRAVLFEWTHLPIHQDVYLRIGLSLRLKNAPCDQKRLRQQVVETYGMRGKLSFLELGMDRAALIDLLGKPEREDTDALYYVERWELTETAFRVNLIDGRFRGLGAGWCTIRDLPTPRGSIAWILDVAGTPQTCDELRYTFDRFCELAPGEGPYEWRDLCQAMIYLAWDGHQDRRVPGVMRKHLLNAALDQQAATEFLGEYDIEHSRDAFVELVEQKMEYAKAHPDLWNWGAPVADGDFNTSVLLRLIGPEHGAFQRLILAGMEHPYDWIRSDSYDYWGDLPQTVALPLLRMGLRDSSDRVRWRSASAFAETIGDESDLPLLRECLGHEDDDLAKKYLLAAIDRLSRTERE